MAELRRARGFSLLEVLVAFSIMALVLGVLYQAAGGSVRAAGHGERHAQAVIMAESLLARFQSVPRGGVSDAGRTADGFTWRVGSSPFPYGEETAATPGGKALVPFYRVSVEVQWDNLGRSHSVRLETAVPEEEPAPPPASPQR